MRVSLLILLAVAACRTSDLGACTSDSQCPSGSTCDAVSRVCVIAAGACFPACDATQVCDGATHTCVPAGSSACNPPCNATQVCDAATQTCVAASSCNPACDTSHTCDSSTNTCVPATSADISVTSPAASASVGASVPVAASAHAPGGVSAVTFQIADAGGTPLATAAGAQAGVDPATWVATLSLAAAPDGPATLTATATWSGGTVTSAPVQLTIALDRTGPTISIAADSTPYARTAVPIPVTAFIDDPSGVPDGGVFLNGSVAPSARDGGLFTFQLDPQAAPAGLEGVYSFQISAVDAVGNAADAGATRVIDDAAPVLSNLRIFKGSDPGVNGVSYPAAVANTGWTGVSFVYSDTIHVKGTLTDLSGIGSASVHVDGLDLNGANVAGAPVSLGCTASPCDFDVQLTLNSAQPEFHTGSAEIDGGTSGLQIPSGALTVTIDVQDGAVSGDATPAPNSASSKTSATTTRFLWQQAITAGNVTGLAVHPSGDVIVATNSSGGDSVYDLAPDQPQIRWHTGAALAQPVGAVAKQPAVGAGDATSAAIYVASTIGNLYSFAPDGGNTWQAITASSNFAVAPAVDSAQWTDGGTAEQLIEPSNDTGHVQVYWASSSTPHNVAEARVDGTSSPIVLGDQLWFGNGSGTAGGVEWHAVAATLGAAQSISGMQPRPHFSPMTDGASIFIGTSRNATSGTRLDMYSINPGSGATNWDSSAVHLAAEPTLGIDGLIYAPRLVTLGNVVSPINASTGSIGSTALFSNGLGTNGLTPLQGSDGHWYLPNSAKHLDALVNVGTPAVGTRSWGFDAPSNIAGNATIDCQGRLFVAAGSTVYAFLSDDRGLADTPWPSLRRDARNTANANAPKYGVRTATGCTQ